MIFLFSYYLFDFIFNLLFMIAYHFTMVIFIFLPFIFISYFKFIFVPFFLIYFLRRHFFSFVLQMRPSCASSASHYFQFLSLLAFWKSSEKNAKTLQTIGKTQVPFLVLLCYYTSWAAWAISYSLSLHPSILNWLNRLSLPEPHVGLRYTYF